jgi:hypothetical protein
MRGRHVDSMSLSGKSNFKHGLRGASSIIASNHSVLGAQEFKTRMIDSIMIPFMCQDWKIIEENMFLFDIFKEEIDREVMKNPYADIYVYKDLITAIEIAFSQQQEISCLEKRLYQGRDDASTMIVKLGGIRLKPELELCDLILGKPDYKNGERHDPNIVEEILTMMKTPRATFANISKYINYKYGSGI